VAYNTLLHQWGYDLDSSVIGGGTAGCQWQPTGWNIVFGLEGEGGYLSLNGSAADPVSPALDTISSTHIGDWYGMITGRLGFAFDRLLLYGKGGVAFVDVQTSVVDACAIAPCGLGLINATNNNDTRATWTAGAGLEWAFDMNWSVKAEYMFIGLNDDPNYAACGIAAAGPRAGATFCWQHELNGIHTAKIGVNYRFGAPLAPVVAKY
jgi:outer membrane immunogenic protein